MTPLTCKGPCDHATLAEYYAAHPDARPEREPCSDCGGSGQARCLACNDGGIDGSGNDCSSCVKPTPCDRCSGGGAEPHARVALAPMIREFGADVDALRADLDRSTRCIERLREQVRKLAEERDAAIDTCRDVLAALKESHGSCDAEPGDCYCCAAIATAEHTTVQR